MAIDLTQGTKRKGESTDEDPRDTKKNCPDNSLSTRVNELIDSTGFYEPTSPVLMEESEMPVIEGYKLNQIINGSNEFSNEVEKRTTERRLVYIEKFLLISQDWSKDQVQVVIDHALFYVRRDNSLELEINWELLQLPDKTIRQISEKWKMIKASFRDFSPNQSVEYFIDYLVEAQYEVTDARGILDGEGTIGSIADAGHGVSDESGDAFLSCLMDLDLSLLDGDLFDLANMDLPLPDGERGEVGSTKKGSANKKWKSSEITELLNFVLPILRKTEKGLDIKIPWRDFQIEGRTVYQIRKKYFHLKLNARKKGYENSIDELVNCLRSMNYIFNDCESSEALEPFDGSLFDLSNLDHVDLLLPDEEQKEMGGDIAGTGHVVSDESGVTLLSCLIDNESELSDVALLVEVDAKKCATMRKWKSSEITELLNFILPILRKSEKGLDIKIPWRDFQIEGKNKNQISNKYFHLKINARKKNYENSINGFISYLRSMNYIFNDCESSEALEPFDGSLFDLASVDLPPFDGELEEVSYDIADAGHGLSDQDGNPFNGDPFGFEKLAPEVISGSASNRFTGIEDASILEYVKTAKKGPSGYINWESFSLPGRSSVQIRRRYFRLKDK